MSCAFLIMPARTNKELHKPTSELGKKYPTKHPTKQGTYAINVISSVKYQAKHRNIPWELTDLEAFETMIQPCRYCNFTPDHTKCQRNGLDRIDNNKGYTLDNIAPCCKYCNMAKSQRTLQEFEEWAQNLYINLVKYA